MKILFAIGLALFVLPLHVWASAALWIDGPDNSLAAGACLAAYLFAVLGLAAWADQPPRKLAIGVVPFSLVLLWWLSLSASNDREWMPEVAHLPSAEFDGDRLVLRNVRNFDDRSEDDYTEHWETREYDLSMIRGVDLFMSYWGSPHIAHTIASWDFGEGNQLAISIETRKEKGESYSALLGFFRQFELYYVVADERDVIRVRTNYRNETVRLYRTKASPELARAILVDYLTEINGLESAPVWYNAATHNCTTTIRHHLRHVAQGHPFDWRILVNGRFDELGYERGNVDTSLPFEELRVRSEIVDRAKASDHAPDFSERIREGLPGSRDPSLGGVSGPRTAR